MDPLRIHAYKTRSIKKQKGQQLLNDFILYSLTAIACTSFCSSPFWYPPFCATFNVFFVFSLPKITSFLFTSKALFIVGNLIIIFLLGESKFFDQFQIISSSQELKSRKIIKDTRKQEIHVNTVESKACDEENDHDEFFELDNDDETCEQGVDQMVESSCGDEEDLSCSKQEVKVVDEEKHGGFEGDEDVSYPCEELNKLVDDFIARINRQRRLEAEFCRG